MPCLICNRALCDHVLDVIMAELSKVVLTVLATQVILAKVIEVEGLTIRLRSRSSTPLSEESLEGMQGLFKFLDFRADGNDVLVSIPEDEAVVAFNMLQMVKAAASGKEYRPVSRNEARTIPNLRKGR